MYCMCDVHVYTCFLAREMGDVEVTVTLHVGPKSAFICSKRFDEMLSHTTH